MVPTPAMDDDVMTWDECLDAMRRWLVERGYTAQQVLDSFSADCGCCTDLPGASGMWIHRPWLEAVAVEDGASPEKESDV
jgi:hypothetical protein